MSQNYGRRSKVTIWNGELGWKTYVTGEWYSDLPPSVRNALAAQGIWVEDQLTLDGVVLSKLIDIRIS